MLTDSSETYFYKMISPDRKTRKATILVNIMTKAYMIPLLVGLKVNIPT